MAHQYSSAPSYGAQYSSGPYYSPFNPSAGQQISNGTQPFQNPIAHAPILQNSANLSNAARHDANTAVHTQPAPLPFVPPFNPEMLKHFPPPPPPPTVGAHFASAQGIATGFPPFIPTRLTPPMSTPHQNHPHPQQPPTPLTAGVLSTQIITGQEHQMYNQALANQDGGGHLAEAFRNQVTPAQINTELSTPGLVLPRSTQFPGSNLAGNMIPSTTSKQPLDQMHDLADLESSTINPSVPIQRDVEQQLHVMSQIPGLAQPLQSDLKERAKAALLSLLPYNIRYENFLAEGVSPQTLQKLYKELGLHWQLFEPKVTMETSDLDNRVPQIQTSPRQNSQDGPSPKILTSASATTLGAKISTAVAPIAQVSQAANPGIERKDRIAQLLAAKAGKAHAPTDNSKSQSPISSSDQSPFQATESGLSASIPNVQHAKSMRSVAQAEVVKQKMEQLKKEAMEKVKTDQARQNFTLITSNNKQEATGSDLPQLQEQDPLPTPIRESLAQQGYTSLIPGLFMTSADSEENDNRMTNPRSFRADLEYQNSSISGNSMEPDNTVVPELTAYPLQFPRKRSVEEDISSDEQQPKRQAMGETNSASVSTEKSDRDRGDNDNASEGEIVEHGTSLETQGFPVEAHPDLQYQVGQTSHEYLTKQTEIDLMRRRIAEMEQRQSVKKGQPPVMSPIGSATSTPTVLAATQPTLSSPLSRFPDQLLGIPKSDDRTNQSPRPLVKATPEQIAERAAQLKADFLRQRALRQKQLQEGLPVLNDEVAKTQSTLKDVKSKLAKIQTEIQQHETSIARAREHEKQLQDEVHRLENQVVEGVSGQKQFANELSDLKTQASRASVIQSAANNTPESGQHATNDIELVAQNPSPAPNIPQFVNDLETEPVQVSAQTNVETENETVDLFRTTLPTEKLPQNDKTSEARATFEGEPLREHEVESGSAEEMPVAEAIQVSAREAQDQSQDSDEAMEESDNDTDDSHMSIDEETDDSVSMSDSGSDEYEPAEPELSQADDEKMESDEYEPAVGHEGQYDETAVDDADDYEPAEDISSANASGDDPMPVNSQSPPAAQGATTSTQSTSPSQVAPLGTSPRTDQPAERNVDDQENGLQLSEADTLTKAQNMEPGNETDGANVLGAAESSSVRYVPYQSPLSSFKSYRFHPLFNEQVKDGYRSLTYSHKIDAKLPICQSELYGNTCTDPDCQDQHFGSMALTDDKILVQMSSANDIKDKVLRDQYLLGLKQVIARLRQEGVKEFSAVADALSQYRRDWTAA